MDSGEVDKELEELELRIERVRGLYEQYFLGIERLEPQVPRKDVDRRIATLRKERIRNTAQRYKLNMLSQRYNTLGQYWGRIIRQIEAGTFKRDVAKAAARFGADEVLNALGKKKDKALEAAAEQAEERADRGKKKKQSSFELKEEDVDWDDDFDDAPTPPPARPVGPPAVIPVMGQPLHASAPPVNASAPPVNAAPIGAFGNLGQSARPAVAASSAPPDGKKSYGGLRSWGGGGAKADPEAAKRRLAELAAQVGGVPDAAGSSPTSPGLTSARPPLLDQPLGVDAPPVKRPPQPAPPPPKSVRGPLISQPLGLDLGDGVPPPAPTQPGFPPPPPPRGSRPGLPPVAPPPPRGSRPGPLPLPSTPAKPPALDPGAPAAGAPAAPPPPAAPPAAPSAPSQPSAAERRPAPVARPSQPKPQPKRSEADMDDRRLREIYSEYVQAKRKANESTAGVTFEKLADSLRVQTDKLKNKHAGRKVDYQVVVKDGKTLIKPIIK